MYVHTKGMPQEAYSPVMYHRPNHQALPSVILLPVVASHSRGLAASGVGALYSGRTYTPDGQGSPPLSRACDLPCS